MGVVEFPPNVNCERCRTPMRRATSEEIQADSVDPRYRHIAVVAAQGDRDFAPDRAFTVPNPEGMIEHPSWLFRCDTCGMRLLWNRLEEK